MIFLIHIRAFVIPTTFALTPMAALRIMKTIKTTLLSILICSTLVGVSGCRLDMTQNNDFGPGGGSDNSKDFSFDIGDAVAGFDELLWGIGSIVDSAIGFAWSFMPF